MKTVLILAATLGLSASGAFAMCGHDETAKAESTTVAGVDMSTTASTVVSEPAAETPQTVMPAEVD